MTPFARWGEGEVLLSRRVEATEEALEAVCSQIAELGASDERVVGLDRAAPAQPLYAAGLALLVVAQE